MMNDLISYFLRRPVIVNAIMFGVIISAIVGWNKIGKEEMPEFAFSSVRVGLVYPGAAAEDVELFVIKPIEDKLKGISGIEEITSTASYGRASLRVFFEADIENLSEKIQELKEAVSSVSFPREVDDPTYRQFKSSTKAIIDVGLYLEGSEILTIEERQKLQTYVLGFKDQVLALPEISGVSVSGYLKPELQIKVDPDKLKSKEISMSQVRSAIESQHVRRPIGNMLDPKESEVSIQSELDTPEKLNEVRISAGFTGRSLKLDQVGQVSQGFEKTSTIDKIQGHEGIILNIQKSVSTDILTAKEALVAFLDEKFAKQTEGTAVRYVLIDDESYDVSNRLEIIGSNGLIGFLLIVLTLFCFLDLKSGIWVAMGIPFSLAVTLGLAFIVGYTVNNMTLAAIIIVLGIVVDDAIIVAENISRYGSTKDINKTIEAVKDVIAPVIASVLTTCIAFIPLFFFEGRFGLFVRYIPLIIFFMLFASLIESFFLLPNHMTFESKLGKIWSKKVKFSNPVPKVREAVTEFFEGIYARFLYVALKARFLTVLIFAAMLYFCYGVFNEHLSYVMFPREESRDFRLKVVAPAETNRFEMARLVGKVEGVFLGDQRGIVTSVQTSIGSNRRGGEVKENEASVRIEIVPKTERKESLNQLLEQWKKQTSALDGFEQIHYQKSRFGSDSGSPIAIQVQENNDQLRAEVIESLKVAMGTVSDLTNIEVERPVVKNQYHLEIKKEMVSRLGVSFDDLATTLRSYIEGDVIYHLNNGEEEVDVRLTSTDENKSDIKKLLLLSVPNRSGHLVSINNLVTVNERKKPANIQRVNYKRATVIYADINKESDKTPLEIAEVIEKDYFPDVVKGKPSVVVKFIGEVEDSREAQSDFLVSILLVIGLIYLLLIFLFDSFFIPLLIAGIIPFGVVGVVMAFYLQGFTQYGFFAVVGSLGMLGVVINDSIVLIDRYLKRVSPENFTISDIVHTSKTRLRAVVMTTVTTVAGVFPTAYGLGGYDSMLSEMMMAMGWGLLFGMFVTLLLVPCFYSFYAQIVFKKWKLS